MAEDANRTPRLEKLTSSIREMANRVNAEFVPDQAKSKTYDTAFDRVMVSNTADDGKYTKG